MSTSPRPSNFKRLARRGGDADFEFKDLGERADCWLVSSSEDVSDESESEISAIGLVCSPPLPPLCTAAIPRPAMQLGSSPACVLASSCAALDLPHPRRHALPAPIAVVAK
jgi:hypothetical protein